MSMSMTSDIICGKLYVCNKYIYTIYASLLIISAYDISGRWGQGVLCVGVWKLVNVACVWGGGGGVTMHLSNR